MRVLRVIFALALAALAAACDRCGDFVPPIRFQADQPQVCKPEPQRPY
jgi:hypothetical protein